MPTALVTDVSCLLTLVASGRADELAEALDLRLVTTNRAIEETASIEQTNRSVLDGLRERQRLEAIDLDSGDEAIEVLVRCAEHLPDQDAAILALARIRGATLASDDSCQRRVASTLFPDLALTSTPALLSEAMTALGLAEPEQRALIVEIHTRSRFLPALNDPLRAWFFERQGTAPADRDDA